MKRIGLAVLLMIAAVSLVLPRQTAAGAATCHPALAKLTVSAASVPGGATATLTVALTCDARTRVTVRLRGFSGVTVPASITVRPRRDNATARLRTAVTHAVRHGEIEATIGRQHLKVGLTITRTPRSCAKPSLTSINAPSLSYALETPMITVRLSCAPTAAIKLSLASSDSLLRVPATVTVGRYYDYALVPAKAGVDEAGRYQARVTARYGSESRSRVITVDPGLLEVAIPAVGNGLDVVDPEVLLTGETPPGGLTIKLRSSNRAVRVPASYTFTQVGSLGGDIPGVTVKPVTRNTPVTISATLGSRTLSASITLLPPFDSKDSATLTPVSRQGSTIYGGDTFLEYQLTLSNPASPDGLTVTYSSPSSSLELQSTSDFISAGFNEDWVDVTAAAVTDGVHTQLQASVGGVTATLPVTIEPGLVSITGVPATVPEGVQFTATVNLAGPVDTATTVEVQALDSILSLPAQVVIAKGASSATFTAIAGQVMSDVPVTLSASLGTTTVYSSSVTVTP
jgi:hypothetical protein